MKGRKISLTEQFVKEMEKKILSLEWDIGDRIPTLRKLSEDMNISRSVVNAGIAELYAKGYLTILPRKAIRVNDWQREGTIAVINGIIENGIWNEDILGGLFRSRALIECECARLAALNRTEANLNALEQILIRESKTIDISEKVKLDLRFHHEIALASKNAVYPLMIKSFEKSVYRLVKEFYLDNSVKGCVMSWHIELYEAIFNKDEKRASITMQQLLDHGEMIVRDIKREV